ncbi:MAG: galactose mutarotase [Saprospiraceae bacterium]|nr:galactose mutarotase [Saprospiraceae bacterium]
MVVSTENFGTYNNEEITLITVLNENGNKIQITNFGGIVHTWYCLDVRGETKDVLLGCPNLNGYIERHPYFGAITGRYANRISNGRFTIDDVEYQVSINLPPHHLHGGFSGLDRKIWRLNIKEVRDHVVITLDTISPDMEEGFPGNLSITVKYTYTAQNVLIIEYFAYTDQPTPINLTNHCYFNLSGDQKGNILDHNVWINSSQITSVDQTLIPTGDLMSLQSTILDFQNFKIIGDHIFADDLLLKHAKGYDHNFVLKEHEKNHPIAIAIHEPTGRRLQVYTDQPAVQLYTGNHLGGVNGKNGKYKDYAGLCLETQHFPDSPNHSNFPNTILRPGDQFYSKTMYKIDTLI